MVWVREELESLELMMSSEAAQSNGKQEERVKSGEMGILGTLIFKQQMTERGVVNKA